MNRKEEIKENIRGTEGKGLKEKKGVQGKLERSRTGEMEKGVNKKSESEKVGKTRWKRQERKRTEGKKARRNKPGKNILASKKR